MVLREPLAPGALRAPDAAEAHRAVWMRTVPGIRPTGRSVRIPPPHGTALAEVFFRHLYRQRSCSAIYRETTLTTSGVQNAYWRVCSGESGCAGVGGGRSSLAGKGREGTGSAVGSVAGHTRFWSGGEVVSCQCTGGGERKDSGQQAQLPGRRVWPCRLVAAGRNAPLQSGRRSARPFARDVEVLCGLGEVGFLVRTGWIGEEVHAYGSLEKECRGGGGGVAGRVVGEVLGEGGALAGGAWVDRTLYQHVHFS